MSKKRTLDNFFQPSSPKRPRVSAQSPIPAVADDEDQSNVEFDDYPTYPFRIPHFPPHIATALTEVPAVDGKEINDLPDLDLLYFQPYIPKDVATDLFKFLRQELFFYRVQYKIKRGPVETQINTPR